LGKCEQRLEGQREEAATEEKVKYLQSRDAKTEMTLGPSSVPRGEKGRNFPQHTKNKKQPSKLMGEKSRWDDGKGILRGSGLSGRGGLKKNDLGGGDTYGQKRKFTGRGGRTGESSGES